MPIYMDVHIVPGVKARDVADAHQKDLFHQDEHQCKCITYWLDEERESIFCLIDAPTKEAVEELHTKAHGLVPNKIIEVNPTLVQSFLGRIYDPADAQVVDGLKVFEDPSFRILMVTKSIDPVLLHHQLGQEKAKELLKRHNDIIRNNISSTGGTEVEHGGDGFISSFSSATKAVVCALSINNELDETITENTRTRIGINGGEPVTTSDQLFGQTIQFAKYMCDIAGKKQVAVTSTVKELISKDYFQDKKQNILSLSPQDETLLELLFIRLEENWKDPDFSVTDYCKATAMSKSQLYRKTTDFFYLSPNSLLKEFRLKKAKEMLKKQRSNISQITFDSGFTSPSYFTKCFKKKYGLLPMTYVELLG